MSSFHPLHAGWSVSGADIADLPARVPGCVHTDLLAAGRIEDPYLDGNATKLSWIGRTDWEYSTSFTTDLGSPRIDGALNMRVYWTIVLPAIRPALAVLGLLTFVMAWNDFQWPLITLAGTDFPTSMVALSDLASGNYVIYRRVLAGAFVATVPLIVLLLIGGRQIVRGIMEGALKS